MYVSLLEQQCLRAYFYVNSNIAKIKILNYSGVDLFTGIKKRGPTLLSVKPSPIPKNRFLGTVNLKDPVSLNYKIRF